VNAAGSPTPTLKGACMLWLYFVDFFYHGNSANELDDARASPCETVIARKLIGRLRNETFCLLPRTFWVMSSSLLRVLNGLNTYYICRLWLLASRRRQPDYDDLHNYERYNLEAIHVGINYYKN
jgi:hypothetical protein